jgi:MAGUK p55 subfamily protein 5
MKHTIMAHDLGTGAESKNKTGFLCGKKSGRRKKRRKTSYLPEEDPELAADEIITYEEVALYYPRSERKRPIVLIGPPNIGRHELRQRLMLDQERFAAAIPRESDAFKTRAQGGQCVVKQLDSVEFTK